MSPGRWRGALMNLGLLLAAALYAVPIVFMVAASFTPDDAVLAVRRRGVLASFVPENATWQNYRDVFARLDFPLHLANSLIVVSTIVVCGLVVNSMAGFALARLRWRGRPLVLALVLAVLVVPLEAIVVPLFFMAAKAGSIDSYHVQIVPFIANAFSIYLFTTFFRSLPEEFDQAARVDGASTWTIYWRICVPLAKPAFASVAILTFLMYWGSYLWPLLVTRGPEFRPLPVAIGQFSGEDTIQWGDIMAFGTLMVLPVVLVFLLFQRWFVRGVAASGLKG